MRHHDPEPYFISFREYFEGKPFVLKINKSDLMEHQNGPARYEAIFNIDGRKGHRPSIFFNCERNGDIWLSATSPSMDISRNKMFERVLRKLTRREFIGFRKEFGGEFEDFDPTVQLITTLIKPDVERFKAALDLLATNLLSLIRKWEVARKYSRDYVSNIRKDLSKPGMREAAKAFTHARGILFRSEKEESVRRAYLDFQKKRRVLVVKENALLRKYLKRIERVAAVPTST